MEEPYTDELYMEEPYTARKLWRQAQRDAGEWNDNSGIAAVAHAGRCVMDVLIWYGCDSGNSSVMQSLCWEKVKIGCIFKLKI